MEKDIYLLAFGGISILSLISALGFAMVQVCCRIAERLARKMRREDLLGQEPLPTVYSLLVVPLGLGLISYTAYQVLSSNAIQEQDVKKVGALWVLATLVLLFSWNEYMRGVDRTAPVWKRRR